VLGVGDVFSGKKKTKNHKLPLITRKELSHTEPGKNLKRESSRDGNDDQSGGKRRCGGLRKKNGEKEKKLQRKKKMSVGRKGKSRI